MERPGDLPPVVRELPQPNPRAVRRRAGQSPRTGPPRTIAREEIRSRREGSDVLRERPVERSFQGQA